MTKPETFHFDLIDSAGFGYVRVWNERHYLLKLALIPLLIKFITSIAVFVLHADDNLLRSGLIMLPGTLAEGWVLAQFLRTLLMNERWPQQMPQERDDKAISHLILRARGIVSATLIFVLIHIVSTVLAWGMLSLDQTAQTMMEQEASGQDVNVPDAFKGFMIIPLIAFMLASIWAFRLAYLYIPYAVLMPARVYISRLGGFMTSVRMLGLYLITTIPCTVTVALVANALLSITGTGEGQEMPVVAKFIITFLSTVVDMITAMIATAAMAYALRKVIPHAPDTLQDLNKDRR